MIKNNEFKNKMFAGAPWNQSNEQAQIELKRFLIAGWIIAAVALLVFGNIAVASLAFGTRCILLSWHKGNAERPNGTKLKLASIALVVVSALELIVVNLVNQ